MLQKDILLYLQRLKTFLKICFMQRSTKRIAETEVLLYNALNLSVKKIWLELHLLMEKFSIYQSLTNKNI